MISENSLDSILETWAAYHYAGKDHGYNKSSVCAKCEEVLRLGALINGTQRRSDLAVPDLIEKVDIAIACLQTLQRRVVKAYHMEPGTQEKKARKLEISQGEFSKQYKSAKEMLMFIL